MRKLLAILFLLCFTEANGQTEAQPVTTLSGCGTYTFKGEHISRSTVFVSQKSYNFLYVPQPYTSFVIGYSEDSLDVKVVVGKDTFQLDKDEHYMRRKTHYSTYTSKYQSNLIIPSEHSDTIFFITNGPRLNLGSIYFLNVPKLGKEISQPQPTYKRGNCPEPTTVSHDVWREGLTPPKEGREATEVEHCIIHHSATSNAAADYIEVMRNIYVYHTEVNGWDDIGYNYVVAPDGTIFLGRDAQGVADHDNILGAHFCSKNSNTMGICMMGTFTNVSPTNAALGSLETLLTWKMEKEYLYPYGSSNHPKSGGSSLGNIAGHRNGCATECPGEMVYDMLNTIRENVLTKLYACGTFVSTNVVVNDTEIKIYPNPSSGQFTIGNIQIGTSYRVLNSMGQVVQQGVVSQNQFSITLPTGLYFFTTDKGYTKKIVVQ